MVGRACVTIGAIALIFGFGVPLLAGGTEFFMNESGSALQWAGCIVLLGGLVLQRERQRTCEPAAEAEVAEVSVEPVAAEAEPAAEPEPDEDTRDTV